MSIIRATVQHNNLPLLLYFEKFFTAYGDYYSKEKERLDLLEKKTERLDMLEKNAEHKTLNLALLKIGEQYARMVADKIMFHKQDIEIIQESTKLLRFMDSELTKIKLEVQKLLVDEGNASKEIQVLLKEQEKILKDIHKLELEKEYWRVLFRMRNIAVIGDESIQEMKLSTGEDEELDETPTDSTQAMFSIVKDFLHDNRYELAESFVGERLKSLLAKSNQKPNLDIAFFFGILGQIESKKNDFPKASGYYTKCLKIREKLLNKDHPDIGTVKYNFSICLMKLKQFVEAENYLKSALEIKEKEFGKEHLTIAMIYNLLGKINDLTNKASVSVNYYNLAMGLLEKLSQTFTSRYLYISIALCRNYVKLQQIQVADTHLDKLFNLIEMRLGQNATMRDSCFVYIKKHLNNINGQKLLEEFGPYDEYNILDLMEILIKHFKHNPILVEAIDVWKSLSLQSK